MSKFITFLFLGAALQPLCAFTIINQTDKHRTVKVQEASRVYKDDGKSSTVVANNEDVKPVVVPPHTSLEVFIEPCTDLLVGMIKPINQFASMILTTSYGPYGKYEMINDEWGLLIHKPHKFGGIRDLYNIGQDYGIMCLSPDCIGNVDPTGDLPAELK